MSKSQLHRWIVTLSLVGLLFLASPLLAQYTIKTLAAPKNNGARDLGISGINNAGKMVGAYRDNFGDKAIVIYPTGFKIVAVLSARSVYPCSVNNHNEIAGSVYMNTYKGMAFIRYSNLSVKVYGVKQALATDGRFVNDAGTKVGYFRDSLGYHGYRLTRDGKFSVIDFPGAVATYVMAINNLGAMVGVYEDSDVSEHGFLLSNGNFTVLDYPGAAMTGANGINNQGEIVGNYSTGLPDLISHSYHYYQGDFQPIDIPGEIASNANAINDSGVVVGYYHADQNYGFVATPVPAD